MDRSMCDGKGCPLARNCVRCPKSGSVGALYSQSWFGITPSGGVNCHFYLPVRDSLDENHFVDLYHPIWRVVSFLSFWHQVMAESIGMSPTDVFSYVSEAFYQVIGAPEDALGQDIVEWFNQGIQADLTSEEQVAVNLLAVVSMMDTHLTYPKYVDKLSELMPKVPNPSVASSAEGNGSIN